MVDANFELVFSKLSDSGKSVIYTRIDSDESAITGSATHQYGLVYRTLKLTLTLTLKVTIM